tara:strand:- start:156 stop:1676 length:1521 start_codon:yes stop_codon:yes gene_type:complete
MSLLSTFAILFETDAKKATKETEELSDALDDVEKSAEGATDGVDGATKAYKDNSSSAGALTKSMFGLVAAFVTFDAIASKVFNTAGSVDDAGKFSQRLGLDVIEINAWGEAAIRNGGSAEAFRGTVESLQDSLQRISIDGGGEVINTLAQLGVSAINSTGGIKGVLEVLKEVGESFQRRGPEQSNTFGKSLGIDAGTILTLQQTRHQLDQLVARQKTLSVITDGAAKKAADFNDAWADTRLTFNSLFVTANNTILPILTDVLNSLNSVVLWVKENQTLVEGFFVGVASVLTAVYLPAILSAAGATLLLVGPMLLLAAPFVFLAAKIGLVVAGIALLYEDIKAWVNGSKSAIGELLGTFEEFKNKIAGIFDSLGEKWDSFIDKVKNIGNIFDFSGDFEASIIGPDGLKNNNDKSGQIVTGPGSELGPEVMMSNNAAAMETINSYSATNLNHGGSTLNQRTQTNNITVGGSTIDARGMTGSEAKSAINSSMNESVSMALGQLADGVER